MMDFKEILANKLANKTPEEQLEIVEDWIFDINISNDFLGEANLHRLDILEKAEQEIKKLVLQTKGGI